MRIKKTKKVYAKDLKELLNLFNQTAYRFPNNKKCWEACCKKLNFGNDFAEDMYEINPMWVNSLNDDTFICDVTITGE